MSKNSMMHAIRHILSFVVLFFIVGNAFGQGNEKLIQDGNEAYEKEQYVEAIGYYTQVISPIGLDDNLDYSPYEIRADITKVERNEKGVILPPDNPSSNEKVVIHKLAECYQKLNDYESAEVWFRESLKYPIDEFPYSRYFYGETLMLNHKYDSAQIEFRKFMTGDIVNRDNKYYILAESKLVSCEFAKNPKNTKEEYSATLMDSMINFGSVSYAVSMYEQDKLLFSATAVKRDYKEEVVDLSHKLLSIYTTTQDEDGDIEEPKKLSETINNPFLHQGAASMAFKGNRLYFTRANPLNKLETKIYFSEKLGNTWTLPQMMNDKVNKEGFKSMDPFVTADGKKLYFASDMPGGEGGLDIWVADLDENGNAINQQNIGWNVNTPDNETSPFAHPLTKALYFSSDGRIGFGGLDIFIAKWDSNSDWYHMAENVGAPINSSRNDTHFFINDKLSAGFITSDRDQCLNCGETDTRIEFCNKVYKIKKEIMDYMVEGVVYDEETGLPLKNAVVEFKDISQARPALLVQTDENGYYSFELAPETDYFAKASLNNYFADQALVSTVDEKESKTFKQDFYLKPIPKGEITIEGIEYDYDKATLRPKSIEILDQLLEFLELNSNLSVEIRSHTDYRGSDQYNLKLSNARAKSVVDYLIQQGIDPSRLKPQGYGENEPAEIQLDGSDKTVVLTKAYIDKLPTNEERETAHQRNRRTAFKVLGQ